jgi:hypothetical protein
MGWDNDTWVGRVGMLNLGTVCMAASSLKFRYTKLGRFILRAKQTQGLMALRLLYARQDSNL